VAIRAAVFDCFGVLIMAGHSLLYLDYPELKDEIRNLQQQSDSGKITRQQFDDATAKYTGLSPEEVEEKYWSINKFNQPMLDWIHDLKQSGQLKTGMLSNINRDWMDVSLPVFEQEKLFDAMVLSADVGLMKPDPAIFKMMADELSLMPNECVMIDDVASNIDGAKLAGMQGIIYVSPEQTQAELNHLLELNNA
jgi:putative hydrolase of the HAD superfamily